MSERITLSLIQPAKSVRPVFMSCFLRVDVLYGAVVVVEVFATELFPNQLITISISIVPSALARTQEKVFPVLPPVMCPTLCNIHGRIRKREPFG